jgi:hypothetical protein
VRVGYLNQARGFGAELFLSPFAFTAAKQRFKKRLAKTKQLTYSVVKMMSDATGRALCKRMP